MSRNYDNWETLVGAVVKREQLRRLCLEDSVSTICSGSSSDIELSFRAVANFRIKDCFDFVRQLRVGRYVTTNLVSVSQHMQQYVGSGTRAVIKWVSTVDLTETQFAQQMTALGDCRHDNVGAPRAYFYSKTRKLIVYDYYAQGSVFDMLQGGDGIRPNWESRVRIAEGAARGIAHLHSQSLFHGNVKSSNIFLNRKNYGCVSEFGLAGIVKRRPGDEKTSRESDVFSFGLLLLELVTGESHIPALFVDRLRSFEPSQWDLYCFDHDRLLVDEHDMAEDKVERFPYVDLDLDVSDDGVHRGLWKMLQVAKRCLAPLREGRPSMSEVVSMLESTEKPVAAAAASAVEKKRVRNRFLWFRSQKP